MAKLLKLVDIDPQGSIGHFGKSKITQDRFRGGNDYIL